MPWCDECNRWTESEASGEGEERACVECGTLIGPPPNAPWHFKLLVVAVVIYLGYRAWQGVDWVIQHL